MATAREMITAALRKISATSANAVPTAEDIDIGLETLNALINSKSANILNTHKVTPYRFQFTPGQLNYKLGPTGDWVTERPMRLEKSVLIMNPIIPVPITEQTILHPFQSTMIYWDAYRAFQPDCQVTMTSGFDTSGSVVPTGAVFYSQPNVSPTGDNQGVFLSSANTSVRGDTAFGSSITAQNLVWEYFIYADYPMAVGYSPIGAFDKDSGTGGTGSQWYKSTGETSDGEAIGDPWGFGDVIGCMYIFQAGPDGSVAFFKNGVFQVIVPMAQLEGHVFAGRN
jgi:hypothetical protein